MPRAVPHADLLERLLNPLFAFRPAHAAIGEREFDVFEDRQVADEIEALEDEADLAIADAGALGEAEVGHRLAVERVTPCGGRIKQTEDGQQRGLAAARRPGNTDEFAPADFQRDFGQGVSFDFIGQEDLLDGIEVDEGVWVRGHKTFGVNSTARVQRRPIGTCPRG